MGMEPGRPLEGDFEQLNVFLAQIHSHAYLLRGNHDAPSYWRSPLHEEIEGRWPHITMLQPGPLEILGELYYVYPGGISEDRWKRQEGRTWFPDEKLVPVTLPDLGRPYRGILGHTGPQPPNFCRPGFMSNCEKDDRLYADTCEEAALVADAIAQMRAINKSHGCEKTPLYIHGHYHEPWLYEFEGLTGRCLGKGELCRLGEPPQN